jgi:hypothetical protein
MGASILAPVVGQPLVGLLVHPSRPAVFAGNFQVYSWSPLNAISRSFETVDGHLQYALWNGLYYAIAPANLAFFGPVLAPLALVGVWVARRWPIRLIVLIVGWTGVVYAFHAGAPWQNFRFTLAYLPPLAIVSAFGGLVVIRAVTGRFRRAVLAVLALGVVVQVAGAVRLERNFIGSKDAELALVRWVSASTDSHADLITFGPTLSLRHYSPLITYDLFDLAGEPDLRAIVRQPVAHYALVDETSLASQWKDRAPYRNFQILRDEWGLTRVGTYGTYSLYLVGAE